MNANELIVKMSDRITANVLAAMKTTPVQTAPMKRLMTVSEAAHYIGRSKRAMEWLVAEGKVPTVKHDTRVFFDIKDLDKWVEGGKG